MGCIVDGVLVGVDRTVDGEVVGVGVGVVDAGAANAVPVPNRSVTQYPFRTHTPDTDPGIGRVEQNLPMS